MWKHTSKILLGFVLTAYLTMEVEACGGAEEITEGGVKICYNIGPWLAKQKAWFLEAKANGDLIKKAQAGELAGVMGNESCDLDSSASATGLAFLYDKDKDLMMERLSHFKESYQNSRSGQLKSDKLPNDPKNSRSGQWTTRDHKHIVVFPILGMPKKDIGLKTEVKAAFERNNINVDDIICIDEVPKEVLKHMKIILVDHHSAIPEEVQLHAIIEIFDHHDTEGEELPPINSCRITIMEVGSCATLIADIVIKAEKHHLIEFVALLKLLHGPMIVDTSNFKDVRKAKAKEATKKKKAAARAAEGGAEASEGTGKGGKKSKKPKDGTESETSESSDAAALGGKGKKKKGKAAKAAKAEALKYELRISLEIVQKIPHEDPEVFLKLMLEKKDDVEGYTPLNKLLKDLKIIWNKQRKNKVALPRITTSVEEFMKSEEEDVISNGINDFFAYKKIDAIVIMGKTPIDKPEASSDAERASDAPADTINQRSIGIIGKEKGNDDPLVERIAAAVEKAGMENKIEKSIKHESLTFTARNSVFYVQENKGNNRKDIIPAIKGALVDPL